MMAVNKTLGTREDVQPSEEEEEEEEVEKLEADVKEMAQKILEYRAALPDQLRTTLASALSAQRPVLPYGLGPAPSGALNTDAGGEFKSSEGAPQAEEDQEIAKKIQLFKDKISSNASAMPNVLKRMKECISKIDKLDSNNVIIHPAFKKEKTS